MSQIEDGDSKVILFTSAIAIAMWIGGTYSISWIVPIEGINSWILLLLIHIFFCIKHWARRGMLFNFEGLATSKNSGKWKSGNKSLPSKVDVYLNTVFLGFAALVGGLIMVGNIIWLIVCK